MKPIYKFVAKQIACVITVATLQLVSISSVCAEPEWWTGEPKDLLLEARQKDKSIVLYFEDNDSAKCQRMNRET